MVYTDYVVHYDPNKDSMIDVTRRVLYSLIIKRLKHRKPCVIFISGDSGEGKSYSSIAFQDLLMEVQGIDLLEYFNDVNVYTPMQYPKKLDALLFDKRLKKINLICMHEAREIVKAKNWRNFLTQSVADVNAMSRTLKRLGIIIISQFIRDITTDIRYTLNFYIKVRRPRGKLARAYISVMWKDDRDPEKPRLRKRGIRGYLRYPDGTYQRHSPKYLEISRPRKELIEIFEREDYNSKAMLIRHKLSRLIKEMQSDLGDVGDKVKTMVEWYTEHSENLLLIGKRRKGKLRLNTNFKEMHELTDLEARNFEKQLNEALEKKGMIATESEPEGVE